MTPRTLNEACEHDLDMPNVAIAVRRYSRGTQSANWQAEDRRKRRIVAAIMLAAALVFWLA